MYSIIRTDIEIDELLEKCVDLEEKGENSYFGETFSSGIQAAIRWLIYKDEESPFA